MTPIHYSNWCPYHVPYYTSLNMVYAYTVHSTYASQVIICSHNTDNVLYVLYVSTLNQVHNFSSVLAVAP